VFSSSLRVDQLVSSAGDAATAALRELPEALVFVFDQDLRFVLSAGQALERLGDPPSCHPGESVERAFPAELWKPIEPLFRSALAGETRSREIWTAERRHCLMVDVGPLQDAASDAAGTAVTGGVAVVRDTTARRRGDAFAPRSQDAFSLYFEGAPIGTGLLDLDGRWLLVNRALCEITGYTVEELIGKRFDGIVHPDDANNDNEQRELLLAGEILAFQVEKRYFDAAGEIVSAILSLSLVRDRDGAPLHYVAQLHDTSTRRQLEDDLRRLSDHDPLTGLRNRRLFEHDLKLQVARSHRYGEHAALMVVHLDAFELLNDLHGHRIGEEMLRAVARALTRRLRQTDLVARMGAERFAVLLPHIDHEGATVVADGLGRVIPACSVDSGEEVLHPAASIGFALIDEHSGSAEQILTEADRAMRARRAGAGRST
jgi:diguanylate cyclase (GGDEF)-like protein/PAS domain S-box-containing protein